MTTSKGKSETTTELAARIADPGFTPSVRRLTELLELVGDPDDDVSKHAERAVLRIETQYAARVAEESAAYVRRAKPPARGRLTRLVARLAQDKRDPNGLALAWLLEALGDDDVKTRRTAARGLGKLPKAKAIAEALTKAFDEARTDDDKEALALALGKAGSETAQKRLAEGAHGRASLIASREVARRAPQSIDRARSLTAPRAIRFHVRSGLEEVLRGELAERLGASKFVAPGVVEAELSAKLADALSVRIATHVGFALQPVERTGDLAADVARALGSSDALDLFRTFTKTFEDAPVRFRVDFVHGGHRRAVVWRIAELVHEKLPELLNDPTDSTWEVVVDEAGDKVRVELVPRAYVDERFAYRQDMVAASSHPTIAAALARVAPRSERDIVWDPFAGAGAELVERARLGPYARLAGTDIDPNAIAAARKNLARAGITGASLEIADCMTLAPEGVNLILTNPPMGRRVHRGTHIDLLERFVGHAARSLVPGGALVWLVPEPRAIEQRAAAAGLALDRAITVDMGGFPAELTVFVKRPSKTRRIVTAQTAPAPRRKAR